jgi:uncharacterized protein DUF5684
VQRRWGAWRLGKGLDVNSLLAMLGAMALGQVDGSEGPGMGAMLVWLAIMVFEVVAFWRIFTKAGKPGWAVLIPIYNLVVFLDVVNRPWWWILLLLIPLAGAVFAILMTNDLSKSFGKGVGFTVGLLLLGVVFYPILGFGDATYRRLPAR